MDLSGIWLMKRLHDDSAPLERGSVVELTMSQRTWSCLRPLGFPEWRSEIVFVVEEAILDSVKLKATWTTPSGEVREESLSVGRNSVKKKPA